MSRRVVRPWDSKGIAGKSAAAPISTAAAPSTNSSRTATSRRKKNHPPSPTTSSGSSPPPSINIHGVSYWSDRFYLCGRAAHDETIPPPSTTTTTPSLLHSCTCGARGPPVLLDRSRLVASLSLKAAILATFTIDPYAMVEEFPTLFGPNATTVVPTLVLHGHKGLVDRNLKESLESSSSPSWEEESTPPQHPQEDHCRAAKRAKLKKDASGEEKGGTDKHVAENRTNASAIKKEEQEEEPPEEAELRRMEKSLSSSTEASSSSSSSWAAALGPTVHLTEVLPTWLPPTAPNASVLKQPTTNTSSSSSSTGRDVIVLDDSEDDDDDDNNTKHNNNSGDCRGGGGVDATTVQRRIRKRGVHHPKYMILFETSGSVVVVVSTANLTPQQRSVDAAWVQRFPAVVSSMESENDNNDKSDLKKLTDDTMRRDGSDFGHVLANFLQCQSDAAREGHMIPQEFLQKYLGIPSLKDFCGKYRFEDARVHLIATVPGEYPGRRQKSASRPNRKNGSERMFLYGPQRVADILARVSSSKSSSSSTVSSVPWLPPEMFSPDDRLIMQPTSLGGKLTRQNLAHLARLYYHGGENDGKSSDDLLDNIDIIWPSFEFMQEIRRNSKCKRVPSPNSVAATNQSTEMTREKMPETTEGFIFLSSTSFNTIDMACISRMAMYETSVPEQLTPQRSPHIKSYARLFDGNEYLLRKKYGVAKAEECFSWFMLTSACLSRGAQGTVVSSSRYHSAMEYSNFELGVLFISKLTGNAKTDRLYCWRPRQCSCRSSSGNAARVAMIHLPIPYCLRPQPYQPDPDEAEMCVTPYFHEIPEGTGSVGQMKLTPLGAKLALSRK